MDRYKETARVIEAVERRRTGLKNAVFSGNARNKRAVYALGVETLRHRDVLDELLKVSGFWDKNADLGRGMVLVLAYDLLFGHGIKGGGRVKRALKESEEALRTQLKERLRRDGVESAKDLVAPQATPPRWVRANLLKVSSRSKLQAVTKALAKAAPQPRAHGSAADPEDDVDLLDPERVAAAGKAPPAARPPAACAKDPHVPWLYRLPTGTDLHAAKAVERGEVVLQDKSSCMPAHVLLGDICVPPMPWSAAPGEGGAKEEVARTCLSSDAPPLPAGPMDVVDTCAAPGNKTSHAAMLLPPGPGQVLAFDKSEDRAALLRRRMGEVGARRVVVRCGDFLETDLSGPEFARARCALVDPSCSGSGMLRADHQTDRGRGAATAEGAVPESEAGRVANLAAFQEKVLWHALQLPAVHRVAYSTCSVYHRENESVVARVLQRCREAPEGSRLRRMRLATALPAWPRRGLVEGGLSTDDAKKVVRCSATGEDDTGGFFVALFALDAVEGCSVSAPAKEEAVETSAAKTGRNARKRQRKKERVQAAKRARAAEA